jgi:hypothetical protein
LKKKKTNQPEEEKEFKAEFDYRDFISSDIENTTEEKEDK